jgi:predicted GNAT family acetyltransferase
MKEEYLALPLVVNEAQRRFELDIYGHLAVIVFSKHADVITLEHTEVEPELEGKGAATAIIEKTLDYIEQHGFRLVPLCPFVVAYLKRHPEWKRILHPAVKNI